jgi:hypothetical protein
MQAATRINTQIYRHITRISVNHVQTASGKSAKLNFITD